MARDFAKRSSTIPWVLLIMALLYQTSDSLPAITQSLVAAQHAIGYHLLTAGLLIGALVVAVLFKILCFVTTKDSSYRYLGAYSATCLALVFQIDLWSYSNGAIAWLWQQQLMPSFVALALYSYYQHSRCALNLSSDHWLASWLSWPLIILAAALLLLPQSIAWFTVGLVSLITLAFTSADLLRHTWQKNKAAATLLLGIFWLGTFLALAQLCYAGLLLSKDCYADLIKLGILGQLISLYLLSSQRFYSQCKALRFELSQTQQALDAQTQQLTLVQQQSETLQLDLEAEASERTFELNMTLLELQETNKRLEEQSTIDALTGVKNRKFFNQRYSAEQLLSRRQQTPLSLLMVDADHFKQVNDNYGHIAGDQVLIEICKRAANMLKRPNDNVCRYGGEEFAILLPNTDSLGAVKVAEAICQEIAKTPISADSQQLKVTVSIGVSTTIVDPALDPDTLLAAADKALYQAKEAGRNQVAIAEPIGSQ